MYSKLDPVLQAVIPRHAESADTRMGIHREDRTGDEGRKRGREKNDEPADLWEDRTVVSVRALGALLASLVARPGRIDGHADIAVSSAQPGAGHAAVPPPQQSESAKAARAYKTMYYTGQKIHQPPLPAPPEGTAPVALSPEEERAIHKLLSDIETLAARGIETLEIHKSGSFLQSLADAAAHALALIQTDRR